MRAAAPIHLHQIAPRACQIAELLTRLLGSFVGWHSEGHQLIATCFQMEPEFRIHFAFDAPRSHAQLQRATEADETWFATHAIAPSAPHEAAPSTLNRLSA